MRAKILICPAVLLLLAALPCLGMHMENATGVSRDVDTTPLNLGGGPDDFGYTWDETHPFNWIDIRGMANTVEVEGLGDDNVVGFFDISGMSPAFKYFWYEVDQFCVGSNGYISFSDKYLMAHPFQRPPSTRRPNDVLFGFVDDLTFVYDDGDTGHVYYNWQDYGDTCIIQFHDVPFWGNVPGGCEGRNQFEILLIAKPDTQGVIVYQYNVQDGTGSGTRYVGWEDVTGRIGLSIPTAEASVGTASRIANTDPQNPTISDMAVFEAITTGNRGFFVYRGDGIPIWATLKCTGNQPVNGVTANCTIVKGGAEVYNADYGFGNFTPGQEKTRHWDNPYVCQDGTGTYTITVTQLVSDYNPTNDAVDVEMHVISLPTDLTYHDGSSESYWAWNGSGRGWGAHFCVPDSVPGDTLVVDEVSVNIGSGTVPCDIWIGLMSEGQYGLPQDTLADTTITITGLNEPTWFTLKVEPPERFLENECFFAAYVHPGESNPYFGMDEDPPFSYQGWEYTGSWAPCRHNDERDLGFTVHANPLTLPDVMVTCLPHQVTVPREKGTLDFRIVYENTTTLSQDEDWWLKVFKGGVQVQKMGPWFVELDPGELVEKEYSLNVPKNAPLALFDFVVYTGTYDSYIDGESSFSFEVVQLGEDGGGTQHRLSIEAPEAASTSENELLMFEVHAYDNDPTHLIHLSGVNLPNGSEFPPVYGYSHVWSTFRWTPGYCDAGSYSATFKASCPVDKVYASVPIQVINANRPPSYIAAEPPGPLWILAGSAETAHIEVTAHDPDVSECGDDDLSLEYAIAPTPTEPPTFIDNGDGTGSFDWQPPVGDTGTFTATFTATDLYEETISTDVVINVYNWDFGDTAIYDPYPDSQNRGWYPYQEYEIVPVRDEVSTDPIYGDAVTDISIPFTHCPFPLEVTLTYNSGSFLEARYGYGWQMNYNIFYITNPLNGDVIVEREDGRTDTFVEQPDGTFRSTCGIKDTLSQYEPGKYVLVTPTGIRYWFDSDEHHYVTSMEDPNGNQLSFTYNPSKQLTQVTDPYGRQLIFTYEDNRLTQISGPEGREASFGYDENDDLVWYSNPTGDTTSYEYYTGETSYHRLKSITDPRENMLSLTYNEEYQVATVTTSSGTKSFAYDKENRRTTATDKNGNIAIYTYDDIDRIVQVEQIVGEDTFVTTRTWDDDYNLVQKIGPQRDTTFWTYDDHGNVLTEVNALGDTTSYTWHSLFNKLTSRTDANGHTMLYEHDEHGNLVSEANPLGYAFTHSYDALGHRIETVDARECTTRFEYDSYGNQIRVIELLEDARACTLTRYFDACGNDTLEVNARGYNTHRYYDGMDRLIRTVDALGCTTRWYYDAAGNDTLEVNAKGYTTHRYYDGMDRLIMTVDALDCTTRIYYDAEGNDTLWVNANRDSTWYGYDALNRKVLSVNALHCTTRVWYDAAGNDSIQVNGRGYTTWYYPDLLGRDTLTVNPEEDSTWYHYDKVGNLVLVVDAEDNETHYRYDACDRVIRVVRPFDGDSAVAWYEYDEVGNQTRVIDPNGNSTGYQYDCRGKVVMVVNAVGDTTRYHYDCVGNLVEEVRPNGNTIEYAYDRIDRLISMQDSVGAVVTYTYDCVGNVLTKTNGEENTTSFDYDALNRLIEMTDPMGEPEYYEYDCMDNLVSFTDREENVTTSVYDALGRKISTIDALSCTTAYEYDCNGNLTTIIDARHNTSRFDYDAVDRVKQELYADGTTVVYEYDGVGNLIRRQDQNGKITTYTYDNLYRLIERDYPGPDDDLFGYDKGGRLTSAFNPSDTLSLGYDGLNRVIRATQEPYTINYAYDDTANTRTIAYPGGKVVTEVRDLRDRLWIVLDGTDTLAIYDYDLAGRDTLLTYRNSVASHRSYNPNGWTTSLLHQLDPDTMAGFEYGFDRVGNRKYARDLHDLAKSEAYQYDPIYRLVDFRRGGLESDSIPDPVSQWTWNLDPVGNWLAFTIDTLSYQNTPNQMNEYDDPSSTSCQPPSPGDDDGLPDDFMDRNSAHDCNGNLLDDGVHTYEYDYENRLVRVIDIASGDTVAVYSYNPLGRRVRKQMGDTTFVYLYDGWRVIEERVEGVVISEYVYGDWIDEILAMDRDGAVYYYHPNSLGSIVCLTNELGEPVERYTYEAYGEVSITDGEGTSLQISAVGNPYLFTGRRWDQEAGLYYYRARHYSPLRGRFLQRDRIGSSGALVNGYEYVNGSPHNWTDVFGMCRDESEKRGKRWLSIRDAARALWRFLDETEEMGLIRKFLEKSVRKMIDDWYKEGCKKLDSSTSLPPPSMSDEVSTSIVDSLWRDFRLGRLGLENVAKTANQELKKIDPVPFIITGLQLSLYYFGKNPEEWEKLLKRWAHHGGSLKFGYFEFNPISPVKKTGTGPGVETKFIIPKLSILGISVQLEVTKSNVYGIKSREEPGSIGIKTPLYEDILSIYGGIARGITGAKSWQAGGNVKLGPFSTGLGVQKIEGQDPSLNVPFVLGIQF